MLIASVINVNNFSPYFQLTFLDISDTLLKCQESGPGVLVRYGSLWLCVPSHKVDYIPYKRCV